MKKNVLKFRYFLSKYNTISSVVANFLRSKFYFTLHVIQETNLAYIGCVFL